MVQRSLCHPLAYAVLCSVLAAWMCATSWACSFSVDITKTHGKLLTASIFGSIAWSPSEDRVAYVAEPLYPDIPSLWDAQKECDNDNNDNSDSKFCWHEDWGEQHIVFFSPSIYVLYKVMSFKSSFDPEDSAGRELVSNGDSGGEHEENNGDNGASVGQVSWALGGLTLSLQHGGTGPEGSE